MKDNTATIKSDLEGALQVKDQEIAGLSQHLNDKCQELANTSQEL